VRVALVTGLFPVLWETPFLNQVTGLVELGHEVDVYADQPQPGVPAHPDIARLGLLQRTRYPYPLPKSPGQRWSAAIELIRRYSGPERATLVRSLNPFVFWRRATSLDQLRRTAAFLPQQSYDVCYCPFAQDARRVLRLRKLDLLPGKLVVALRGSDFSRYLKQRGAGVYRQVFAEADLLLPVCEAFAARLRSLGCPPEKIAVHHTGINLKRFPFRPRQKPQGELRLITVGRLVEKKGISYALRAVRQLCDAGVELSYQVIGEGPLRSLLEHESELLGIGRRVRFAGVRSHGEVEQALGEAHILLAPCVTARDGDEEGIPNVLREGMASGLPVVATYHSGIPELIEDGRTGYLAPEHDSESLSERVLRLLQNADLWGPIVAAARRRVEEDDIERLNRRFVELLQGSAVETARRPAGATAAASA
jgi:colanic acid/amylovoran biosynthesis glycosyltransferase